MRLSGLRFSVPAGGCFDFFIPNMKEARFLAEPSLGFDSIPPRLKETSLLTRRLPNDVHHTEST
jgi:hypothetical protein